MTRSYALTTVILIIAIGMFLSGVFTMVQGAMSALLEGSVASLGWALIGAAVSVGCAGMIRWAWTWPREKKQRLARQEKYPDKPWRWVAQWNRNQISSHASTGSRLLIWFAVVWNLAAWGMMIIFVFASDEFTVHWRQHIGQIAIVGLFPLAGLGVVLYLLADLRRLRAYGESMLTLQTKPGIIGGALRGDIRLSRAVRTKRFRQRLVCVEVSHSGGSEKRRTERVLWETSRVVKPRPPSSRRTETTVPVLFHIPFDALESHATDGNSARAGVIHWRLDVTADAPGIAYAASFSTPVFRTNDSSPDYIPDDSSIEPYLCPLSTDSGAIAPGISRQRAAGLVTYRFTGGRNTAQAAAATFAAFFIASLVLFAWQVMLQEFSLDFSSFGWPWIVGAGCVLLTWFCLKFALFVLRLWFGQGEVVASPTGLSIRSRLFGLGRRRLIAAADIAGVEHHPILHEHNATSYLLVARNRAGGKFTLANYVKGEDIATTILGDIRQALNLPATI